MKLITNIKPPFLSDIICAKSKNFEKIKVAVAYCENYELFEYCKEKKIKLDYFARLDNSINLDLGKLKSFLTNEISIRIIGGNKFHPKVIWCDSYGVYIGSANLTQSAWENNIECGLWLTQKEIKDNNLTDSLNNFFKFIQKESKSLKKLSEQDILKLNKYKQTKEKTDNTSSEASPIIKENFGIFDGCPKEKHPNIKSPQKEKNTPVNQQSSDSRTYSENSDWNDVTEMMCLLILKILKEKDFLRGLQANLCREMAKIPNMVLDEKTINAKVSNYKSVSGENNPSNASKNTKRIYEANHTLSIKELEEKIQNTGKYEFYGFSKKY